MLEKIIQSTKDFLKIPKNIEDQREYAVRNYFAEKDRKSLFEDVTPAERTANYHALEQKIKESMQYMGDKYLRGLMSKAGKNVGLGTLLYDGYHLLQGTPWSSYSPLKYALVTGKSILEAPAMAKYLWDTHDIYGGMEWLGGKIASILIPFGGAAYDRNVLQRVVQKKAMKKAINDLLKEKNLYVEKEPIWDRIKNRIYEIAGKPRPREELYTPAYA